MKKYFQLIIGFILLLFLGVAYAWSLFMVPLEKEFGWSRDETSLVFTISMICFCIGGIAGGRFNHIFGHRRVLVLASVIITIGFAGCANVHELWQIYCFYGVLVGFSIGALYNVIISTVNTWFQDRIGFSSGIMTMGYGAGSFALGSLISYTNNLAGWRSTFYMLAIIFFLLIFISSFIIRKFDHELEESVTDRPVCGQLEPMKMLRTRPFYYYYFWCALISAIGLSVIGHASPMSIYLGASADLVIIATGTFSIANGVGRVIFGILYDTYGRRLTMMIVSIFMMLGVVFINAALKDHSLYALFLANGLIGISYGGTPPCNSSVAKELYGSINYGENFSILTSGGIVASLIGPYFLGVIMTIEDSYGAACKLFIPFIIIALILQHILTRSLRRY